RSGEPRPNPAQVDALEARRHSREAQQRQRAECPRWAPGQRAPVPHKRGRQTEDLGEDDEIWAVEHEMRLGQFEDALRLGDIARSGGCRRDVDLVAYRHRAHHRPLIPALIRSRLLAHRLSPLPSIQTYRTEVETDMPHRKAHVGQSTDIVSLLE